MIYYDREALSCLSIEELKKAKKDYKQWYRRAPISPAREILFLIEKELERRDKKEEDIFLQKNRKWNYHSD